MYAGGCHSSDVGSKRDFIVAFYVESASGVWTVPKLPSRGLCGLDRDGCDLREHHYRDRKTGPMHRLLVGRCVTHKRAFTLYPAGYVPYARTSMAPTTKHIEQSLFLAALDAVQGRRWCDAGYGERSWPTQQRHIARAGGLLGLCGGLGERAAEELGVALHVHAAGVRGFARGGYRARGEAVVDVLMLLESDEMSWPRLLRIGEAVGVCGRGYLAGSRRELRPLFR